MTFFWFVEPWRALLGKQRKEAPSEPVRLAKAFADWGKANPKQRQAVGRISSALARSGYESLDDLKSATDAELLNVQGIGAHSLRFIRQIGNSYDED
jgi:DNA-directed RNA polymerase alpha subunit